MDMQLQPVTLRLKVHIDVYVADDKVAHGDFVNVALTKDGQVRSITDK